MKCQWCGEQAVRFWKEPRPDDLADEEDAEDRLVLGTCEGHAASGAAAEEAGFEPISEAEASILVVTES